MSDELAMKNAEASLKIEGFIIDDECKKNCKLLLSGEMDLQHYIFLVRQNAGLVD